MMTNNNNNNSRCNNNQQQPVPGEHHHQQHQNPATVVLQDGTTTTTKTKTETTPVEDDDVEKINIPVVVVGGDDDNHEHEKATTSDSDSPTTPKPALTRNEIWNLTFSLLAWACTVCNLTLVVGTSAVVIISIGGSTSISTMPLGVFFLGSSIISLTATPWIFDTTIGFGCCFDVVVCGGGRKFGFLVGTVFTILGTLLGAISIIIQSPMLLILSTCFFGMATGIGFIWRFAVVDVVPKHYTAKAITYVVSGGCIAAFLGPESAQATKDMFGEDLLHMGVFFMTGIFGIANIVFTSLVQFPTMVTEKDKQKNQTEDKQKNQTEQTSAISQYGATFAVLEDEEQGDEDEAQLPSLEDSQGRGKMKSLLKILMTLQFIIPVLVSTMSWILMATPMSLVRVAMEDVHYTSRQSLTVVEIHFLSMYAPGFITGSLIQRYGYRTMTYVSCVFFAMAELVLLFASNSIDETRTGTILPWLLGLSFSGFGWNLAFSSATVWVTSIYTNNTNNATAANHCDAVELKSMIQAANEFGFFFLAGSCIFCGSYIYDAGGTGLDGWKTLNYVVVGFLMILILILIVDRKAML